MFIAAKCFTSGMQFSHALIPWIHNISLRSFASSEFTGNSSCFVRRTRREVRFTSGNCKFQNNIMTAQRTLFVHVKRLEWLRNRRNGRSQEKLTILYFAILMALKRWRCCRFWLHRYRNLYFIKFKTKINICQKPSSGTVPENLKKRRTVPQRRIADKTAIRVIKQICMIYLPFLSCFRSEKSLHQWKSQKNWATERSHLKLTQLRKRKRKKKI